jgi:hypothetical protein
LACAGWIRTGGRANRQVVAEANEEASKRGAHLERMVGALGPPSPSGRGEGQRRRRRNWVQAVGGVPGVRDDDMPRKNSQRKHGTTRGSPRRSRTAKASRISRQSVKSRCACEWGGWGRISDDGSGQNNPNRSEDPWGRAIWIAHMAVHHRVQFPAIERNDAVRLRSARRVDANRCRRRVCREQA